MTKYYKHKIAKILINIDIVFVIRGASLTCKAMEYLREKAPYAKYYMYQWDSVKNNPNALIIEKYFDCISTFDMLDAEKYKWRYRPLFFCKLGNGNSQKLYDVAYICSLHSQRIAVLNSLNELAKEKNIKIFQYLYTKRIIYLKKKYLNHHAEFIGLKNQTKIKFIPLSLEDTNTVYDKSRIVVDYAHPDQNGFTMRTIESIGQRCKLITNNQNVKNSDFYQKNNVFIYDSKNFDIPDWFLETPYEELPAQIYQYYSLDGWLNCVLEGF